MIHCSKLLILFYGGKNCVKGAFLYDNWNIDSFQDLWTPLHEAADTNHPEVLEYLLREKANINAQTQAENTPLHLAVKRKKLDAAHRLLNASPAPDVTIKAKGKTPLQMARDSNLDQTLINKIEKLEQKILAQRNQSKLNSNLIFLKKVTLCLQSLVL